MTRKTIVMTFVIFTLLSVSLFAEKHMIDVPGMGEIGIETGKNGTLRAEIPMLGSVELQGYYKNDSDYKFSFTIPVDLVAEFTPGIDQILEVMGLDSMTMTLSDTGTEKKISFESGGLGMLREYIGDVVEALPEFGAIADEIIGMLELKSMVLSIKTENNGTITTRIKGELSLAGAGLKFNAKIAEISLEAIAKAIVNEIYPALSNAAGEILGVLYNELEDMAGDMVDFYTDAAELAFKEAMKVGHDVSSSLDHGRHDFDQCYYECVPKYAHNQSGSMLEKSNQLAIQYYAQVAHKITRITGKGSKEKREQLISKSWDSFEKQMDSKWNKIYKDDETDNFFFKDSSEKKGRSKYKDIIKEDWDYHKEFRKNLKKGLLTNQATLAQIRRDARYGMAFYMNINDSGYTMDVVGAKKEKGTNIWFYKVNGGLNQLWYLIPAEKKNVYYIQSAATGKYLHIAESRDQPGSNLHLWSGKGGPQTMFKLSMDKNGFYHWTTLEGNSFNYSKDKDSKGEITRNLSLAKKDNSKNQQFTIFSAPIQPLVRPGIYNIFASTKKGGSLYLTSEEKEEDGANIYLTKPGKKSYQEFSVTGGKAIGGRATYLFYNTGSKRYIHTKGKKYSRGTNVFCWKGYGSRNTRFILTRGEDNRSFKIAVYRGNILEAKGKESEVKKGANAILWNDGAQSDQRWYFTQIKLY